VRSRPKHFNAGPGPAIYPADAVVALLTLEGGRYVMQLRDDRPDIIYPGHWACFGGAVRCGEMPLDALRRELSEELEFEPAGAVAFATFDFDLGASGHGRFYRMYFEVSVTADQIRRFVLHEGAGIKTFAGPDLLQSRWVAPHDAFAIWLHSSQSRLGSGPASSSSIRS
jgi:ADP-ribose pyrophosphatase YjhB (NUDIX family)